MKKEKIKVLGSKKWSFELQLLEDGRTLLLRENDGFTAYELLGILKHTENDIMKQMVGEIVPDIIERKLITNDNKNDSCR